jgi:peroxiredoxin Q/BCP
MSYKINIGDKVPSFSLKDEEGIEITNEDLLGSPYVLYFYPKDDTPGCTLEACAFRDNIEDFNELDLMVFGISPDGPEAHRQFKDKYQLNFPLLCDENLDVARAFDVVTEKEKEGKKIKGIMRTTFVIDSSGIIRWIERPVSVEGHIERVLQVLRQGVR